MYYANTACTCIEYLKKKLTFKKIDIFLLPGGGKFQKVHFYVIRFIRYNWLKGALKPVGWPCGSDVFARFVHASTTRSYAFEDSLF